jgi:poly(A) polymerase
MTNSVKPDRVFFMHEEPQNPFQALLQDKGAQSLYQIYHSHGGELRFVGGCVRDILAGRAIGDLDLATTALPQESLQWLGSAGITVKPTGLKHGTITAIIDKKPYEITTLRQDIATDGRWAEVAFGTSWEEDAKRRDFTMNGLSYGFDGKLYDYVGGQEDIKTGHVRFIGDAATRCREDYLRILRLFRFWGRFGTEPLDKDTLVAVQENAAGLADLSRQRIWMELKKILSLPRVLDAIIAMQTAHIIPHVFDETVFHTRYLKAVLECEENLAPLQEQDCTSIVTCPSLRHLAILHTEKRGEGWAINWQDLSERFLLSGRETDHIATIDQFGKQADYWLERPHAMLYQFEKAALYDALLLCYATGLLDQDTLAGHLKVLYAYQGERHLPVTAQDLMDLGIAAGPQLGNALQHIRQFWLDHNCKPDKAECLHIIQV